ncbi:glucokinase [Alteraurantiacibacter aestuarii]|uniref:Glucokinase n=1 Tax=Alteraurantiacibacter aestuarii TaxID=650004 RepID=A0A844ZLX5_9SPHN|nr:glucokinase [Alteraurantiacibacter aestuarii]MXO88815.1 glucokinase [Alteraurantiacibacter aestuarii]
MELVTVDIGGTHARFAIAGVAADRSITMGEPITLKTSDYASLKTAWEAFESQYGQVLPRRAAIAIAGPVTGETVRMTNNSWVLHTGALDEQLDIDAVSVMNDFAAVAHAVAHAPEDQLLHVTGPKGPLPGKGTISVIGPGTGLGVAQFYRNGGTYHVQATEGGHIDFAAIDALDDALMAKLRSAHRRVSTERINSGPGIVHIYEALAALEKRSIQPLEDREIWQAAFSGKDSLAVAAMDRFCLNLGSVAGDYALAHGACGVVLAGGLGYRMRDILPKSGFGERFRFKGRYEGLMASIPVKLITHPQPGLYGAAAAFASEHGV